MSFPYLSDLLNAIFGTQWNLPVPLFGLVVAAAIAVSARLLRTQMERFERTGRLPLAAHTLVADLVGVSTLAGLIGARVFHILDYPAQFRADPAAMIFTRSGFSIFGGICFGIIAAVILLKRRSVPVLPTMDAAAPALALGYAIGRLGCQIAGDGDWGVAADITTKPDWLPTWLWAQTYDGNILVARIPPPGVYPTPLYESAMSLVVLVVVGSIGILATFPTRKKLARVAFSLAVITALSACVSH
jgi:phosphatidylglycerol:prolipoprotein diacylglycerol transferase